MITAHLRSREHCFLCTFCLRGGEEQRSLKLTQFVHSYEPDYYTYVETGLKNKTGSSLKVPNKVVPVYACPEQIPRCLVYFYISKIPPRGKELDVFYLRPVSNTLSADWYEAASVGKELLKKFLSCMCDEAGINSKKTNHSLRATGTTVMFNANVPDKIIMEVTGHMSNALSVLLLHRRKVCFTYLSRDRICFPH